MLRFFHVSDLHFTGDPGDNARKVRFLQKVGQLMTFRTDHLIVTGDVVNNGLAPEYEQARSALEPFEGRLLLVPGNHDYAGQGFDTGLERARRFETLLARPLGIDHPFMEKVPIVRTFVAGDVKVLTVGLNSNILSNGVWDLSRGKIGPDQMSRLRSILTDALYEDHWKLVYLHCQCREGPDFALKLIDGRELVETVTNRAHVVAYGHHAGGPPPPPFPVEPGDMPITPPMNGIPYRLNANLSVEDNHCLAITFEAKVTPGAYPAVVQHRFR